CPMAPGCHGLREQGAKIDALVSQGKDIDAIKAAFVADYGEPVLLEPPDRGFNRMAWLFPYVAGAVGATGIGMVAWRWSRKPDGSAASSMPVAAVPGADSGLKA